jgi:voltage-gated potassium channel Kch
VCNHTVVVGYGTKGRAAVETLLGDGAEPSGIVEVDTDRAQLEAASALGGDRHRQRHPLQRAADRRRRGSFAQARRAAASWLFRSPAAAVVVGVADAAHRVLPTAGCGVRMIRTRGRRR